MASDYSSLAKITCPKSTGAVVRKRLFRLLDTGRKKPVIWVSGPAGSGKTTVVSSYLNYRKLRCLWYQIDEGDMDIANFFYYLRIAAKNAHLMKRKALPLFTPEYHMGIDSFTRRFFEELYNRLNSSSVSDGKAFVHSSNFFIVFDNYQDVPKDSPLHEIIKTGLSVMPDRINMIFISRTQPTRQLSRLRTYNKVAFLEGDEMRFSLDETSDLLHKHGVKNIPPPLLNQIQSKTDGWAAALVLLSERIKRKSLSLKSIPEIKGEEIFDYFLTEVFERTDAETQTFLLKTTFLPYMTPQLCEKLTLTSNAFQILSEFDHNNFFITKHVLHEGTYQYHPLFRDFLLERAKKVFTREQLFHVKQDAARLLEESGYLEDAATLYTEIDDWKNLERLVLTHARFLIAQGRTQTLEKWLLSVPTEHVEPVPWLSYWAGICRLPFHTKEARAYFEKSFAAFDKSGDSSGAFLAWAGIVESIYLERSDFSRMDPYIEWIDKMMGDTLIFPSHDIEIAVVTGMISILTFRAPDYLRKAVWLARAQYLLGSDLDMNQKITIASALHLHYIYIGECFSASQIIAALKPFMHVQTLSPLAQIKWCLVEALNFHLFEAKGEECLRSIKQGLDISRRTGVYVMDSILLNIGAYGALITANFREMDSLLSEMSLLTKSDSYFDIANYNCCLLCRDLYREDFHSALRHAKITLQVTEKTKSPLPLLLAHLGLSQALFETGMQREAFEHLALSRSIAHTISDFKWDIFFLFPQAYMAFKKGNESEGIKILRKAMASGKKHGYINMLYWRPVMMAYLCVQALEKGIEVDYVQELISRRNLFAHAPPVYTENWPFPVKVYTLGRFEIFREGKPIRFTGKTQQKPLSMLKALIALGGGKSLTNSYPTSSGLMQTVIVRAILLIPPCIACAI